MVVGRQNYCRSFAVVGIVLLNDRREVRLSRCDSTFPGGIDGEGAIKDVGKQTGRMTVGLRSAETGGGGNENAKRKKSEIQVS